MSFLFGSDEPDPVPAAPAPPTRNSADIAQAAADERRRRINASGRASTMLTGGAGLAADDSGLGRKTLLGA